MQTPRSSLSKLFEARALTRHIRQHTWRLPSLALVVILAMLATVTLVSAARLFVPAISATKTATLIDGDGDNKADPGESIEYSVVIDNSAPGASVATGVTFTDSIDANTTLTGGSLNISPLALNDSYETIGNTLLEVGGVPGTGPAVHVNGDLLDNDTEFLSDTYTISEYTNPANGTLSAFSNTSGTFTYLPNPGFTGNDTFTYTLADSGGLTDTATVTINVSQMVWYVKNNPAPGGLGRSTDPFDTLAEAESASAANQTVYVFSGDATATGQNAGILLKNGQSLLGEGVALTVPVSVNGGPNPTTLHAAGSAPLIDNTGGTGVGVSVLNITGVVIRGLNIAGNINAVDVSTTGANNGFFELANNTIRSAGQEGIDINGGGSGTLTVSLHDNIITSTGNGIDIERTSGTVNITAFDDNLVTGNTGGAGININGGTSASVYFDSTPGGSFQPVSGGATVIGASVNPVGGAGLVLANVTGDLSFNDLDIVAGNGTGLQASSTPAFTGSTGFRLSVGSGVSTIAATGGPVVNLTLISAALPFQDIDSTASSTAGVALASVSGSFSADSGSSISNASGIAFSIDGGTATVTYDGTITDDVGTLVSISNTSGSTIRFRGAITDGDDGDGGGISLTGNTGSTIRFSGGLALSTGSNPAFTATGGAAALEICDENPCNPAATGTLVNKLTTTTGTALNVASTTIGPNNLEFRSISSNGAANGILLSSTGASGNLVVKGDNGSSNNASGGTIQNTTGHGISLVSTQNVSLDQMSIQSTAGSGINGVDVTNFSFTNGTINNSGDAIGESNIAFNGNGTSFGNNLDGTLTITGSILTNAFDNGIHVANDNGTISNAVIQNNTITSSTNTATSKGSGIQLIGTGNATTTSNLTKATISGNIIRNFPGNAGIQVNYGNSNATGPGATAGVAGSATDIISITNNIARGYDATNRFGTQAITFAVSGGNSASRSQGNFNVSNNGTQAEPIGNSLGIALGVGNNGFSTMTATINNNVIVANNTLGSGGISGGNGAVSGGCPGACGNPLLTLTVTNNSISQTDGNGILLVGRGSMGTLNLGIRNNTVAAPLTGVRPGIRVDAGNSTTGSDDAVCLDISGNTSGGSGGIEGIGLRKQGTIPTTHDFGIEGMAATSSPDVEAFVRNQNPGSASGPSGNGVLLLSASSGFSNCSTTAFQPQSRYALVQPSGDSSIADSQMVAGSQVVVGSQTVAQVSPALAIVEDSSPLTAGPKAAGFSKQSAAVLGQNLNLAASNSSGGRKPLLLPAQPAPVPSGETVAATIGTLPAGERVTIQFRVTVNNPLPPSTQRILNQGTVSGSNFSNVVTTDPDPDPSPLCAGSGTKTCTPVDRPDTAVSSITRLGAELTNAGSVSWTVTFADPILDLASSNFTLVNTGLGGTPAITSVVAEGSLPTAQWTVTASTGTDQGTLGLNLITDGGLTHDLINSMPFTGETYSIDRIAPTTTSFTRQNPAISPTNADVLVFRVTFSEAVMLVSTGDFAVTGTTATVTSVNSVVTGVYDVTASGGDLASFDGDVELNFDGALNITDLAGNALANTGPSTDEAYTVDNTIPTITIQQAAGQADPAKDAPINFTVVFSEEVTGFETADLDLSASTAPGTLAAVITGGPATYTVAISGMTANGTVSAAVVVDAAQDAAGNSSTASTSTDNTITYDTTIPTVTLNQASGQADPTGASTVYFTAIFSEPVSGFTGSDVTLTGSAGATTAVVTEIAPNNGTTYNVAVSGMTGSGTVIAEIGAGKAGDLAGNLNAASTSEDNSVTFTVMAPSITSLSPTDPNTSTVGQPVTFKYTVTATPPDTRIPSGTVTVTDGTQSCSASVSDGSCAITFATAGPKTVTATYEGDEFFNGSVSASQGHTVGMAATSTALTLTYGSSILGTPVTLTATLTTTPPSAVIPTGNVTFWVDEELLGSAVLNASGIASLVLPSVPSGQHSFTAIYDGNVDFAESQITIQELVPWRLIFPIIFHNSQ